MLNNETSLLKTSPASAPVWPLPEISGRRPILLVFDANDHGGVELAYPPPASDRTGPLVRAAKPSDTFSLPPMTPVFSVADGVVIYAGKQLRGHAVIVEHGNGWLTYYGGLQVLFTTAKIDPRPWRRDRVRAGDLIGFVGDTAREPLQPLRFEMWRHDEEHGYQTVDPIRYMRRWMLRPWVDSQAIDVSPQQAA